MQLQRELTAFASAAVLEARIAADHNRVAHVEVVLTAKVGAEAIVGDAPATSLTETKFRLRAWCSRSSAATRHYPARQWAARSAVIANQMRLVF